MTLLSMTALFLSFHLQSSWDFITQNDSFFKKKSRPRGDIEWTMQDIKLFQSRIAIRS
jgi:hypothetical protein